MNRSSETPAVTVTAGTNLPVPPIYRGSSKKEKRDFMDSYAIYTRRIKALNQGTQASIFVMPLSACIEQSTMVRICGFELFKDERDITETEWKNYFLSAHISDHTAYKTLEKEVKSICMDIELQDAESRLSRLVADFYTIVDRLNMEDMIQTEPKKVVGYLVEALRPPAFKAARLRVELEGFMRFEAHIAVHAPPKSSTNFPPSSTSTGPEKKGPRGTGGGKATSSEAKLATVSYKAKPPAPSKTEKPDKKCFKCGNPTHGVFQCPNIASLLEAKEIYEKSAEKKNDAAHFGSHFRGNDAGVVCIDSLPGDGSCGDFNHSRQCLRVSSDNEID
ncbi:hypothetical protein F442_16351 [Phytophthora nicotianae P10297]|uniref:CCHC-type domain-containing protein n=1 Tax=Phytophthora nicotianae P10297 TaxID=1317064 RepID=W2YLF0_PHYNI|nr:hypothetical protein F442_16351 [Phytophthora nicotianae P10297]